MMDLWVPEIQWICSRGPIGLYGERTSCTSSVMFRSSQFLFLVFGYFWQRSYENTKILRNLCLHLARQDGEEGKKTERKSRN